MRTRRPAAWLLIVAATFTALVLRTSGPPAPTPPGTFACGALGDAPYYPWDRRYSLMLQDMDGHALAFSDDLCRALVAVYVRAVLGFCVSAYVVMSPRIVS
jgi:hypothetical protein